MTKETKTLEEIYERLDGRFDRLESFGIALCVLFIISGGNLTVGHVVGAYMGSWLWSIIVWTCRVFWTAFRKNKKARTEHA